MRTVETWKRQHNARSSLKALLLRKEGRGDDLIIPSRGKAKRRTVTELL